MSYLVIARKYRPQNFTQVVGQDHISNTLQNALKENRVHHAYLFSGPRGTGKTSLARILAKALRCENLGDDKNPCNKCPNCLEINEGSSLDVIEIDAASNNGVDNVRDLRENVSFAASSGKYKIYIIDEVHMLSTAAFNALLKTLEEPPPHVVFILATTELHKVPITIQSRCQRFEFKKVAASKLKENLEAICKSEKIKIDDASLQIFVNESEGCLRDAQSLLDRSIALCGKDISIENLNDALGLMDRQAFAQLCEAIAENNPGEALKLTQTIFDKGLDPKVFIARLVDYCRDLHYYYFSKTFTKSDELYNQTITRVAAKLSVDQVVRALDLSLKCQSGLTGQSNTLFAAESFVVKLSLTRPIENRKQPSRITPSSSAPTNGEHEKVTTTTRAPAPMPKNISSHTAANDLELSKNDPANLDHGLAREKLEKHIRSKKTAWTPVLNSILDIEQNSKGLKITAKEDFAGKRLNSKDGQELLKKVFQVNFVEIDFNQSTAPKRSTLADKKELAANDNSTKAALKAFAGAQVAETKILDDQIRRPK